MSERDDLLKQLQSAAFEVLGDDAPTLTEDTSLGEKTIDSLDLVEILMIIEDEEDFELDGSMIGDIDNIGGVIDAILAMRAVASG